MKINMKKNFFTAFGILATVIIIAAAMTGGYSSRSNYIVNATDESLIEDGDTLLSGWYEIGGADNVGVFFEVSDSVTARVDFFYKFGPSGQRKQVAALDSIGLQNRAGANWSTQQTELRGYGTGFSRVRAAGDTVRSKIPGANYIQAKVTVGDVASSQTGSNNVVRVGIITND